MIEQTSHEVKQQNQYSPGELDEENKKDQREMNY